MCGRCLREGDTEESWMKVVECAPVKKRKKTKSSSVRIEPTPSVLPVQEALSKPQWLIKNLFVLKLSGSVSYLELMRCESSRLHFRSCNTVEEYSNEIRMFLNSECVLSSADSVISVEEDQQEVLQLHLLTDRRAHIEELSSVIELLNTSIHSHLQLKFGTAFIIQNDSRQENGSFASVIHNIWHRLSASLLFSTLPSDTYTGQEMIHRLMIEKELAPYKLLILTNTSNLQSEDCLNSSANKQRKISAREIMSLITCIFNHQRRGKMIPT